MISTPLGLIAFSLSHGTLSWSETQHLRSAGLDEWIQHLTNTRGRWLAAHIGGVGLFPLIGMTISWMLPRKKDPEHVSKVALIVYCCSMLRWMPCWESVHLFSSTIAPAWLPRIASGQTVHSRRCSSRHRPSTGSIEAPALPWKSAHWLPPWRFGETTGWRVSLPLATAGYVLAQSHFPPYGAIAGLALGIAVWQYLVLKHRVGGQPSLSSSLW